MTSIDKKLCECGCGNRVLTYGARFLRGHNSRVIGKESRESAGAKNSVNMKRFFKENPDKMKSHMELIRSLKTEESETRRKQSVTEALQQPATRALLSQRATKLWESDREKMLEAGKRGGVTRIERQQQYRDAGGHGSEKWRNNVSLGITQKYLDGGFEWSRGDYTSTKSEETYYYRSSWELQRMQVLDLDAAVLSWSYEPFSIEYVLNGEKHRYVPDFIIRYDDGSTVLEEVGPKSLKESSEINVAKSQAGQQYCASRGFVYRIWQPDPISSPD